MGETNCTAGTTPAGADRSNNFRLMYVDQRSCRKVGRLFELLGLGILGEGRPLEED